jgi:MYXO-CTERM domain-containing protein
VTDTPTITPTVTPVPNGGACSLSSVCQSGNCANGVCCDTACTDPLMRCNLPGQVGTCASAAAEAPTLTSWGTIAGLVLLATTAAWAIRRRRI